MESGPLAPPGHAGTLDRERADTVTVDYATEDGTPVAGVDYDETSGTRPSPSASPATEGRSPILRAAALEWLQAAILAPLQALRTALLQP